jgi:hypothetical protein
MKSLLMEESGHEDGRNMEKKLKKMHLFKFFSSLFYKLEDSSNCYANS